MKKEYEKPEAMEISFAPEESLMDSGLGGGAIVDPVGPGN